MIETQYIEKKSIKLVVGSTSNFDELAKDCVCFANARGGTIHIGIEDEDTLPPAHQKIDTHQPEIICLGLIAQRTTLTATEFSKVLNLPQQNAIRDWLGRLQELGLVKSKGKTKGVEYFITPEFLQKLEFKGKTSLKKIENYRLKELIHQDLLTYPYSAISEIHQRIGTEIAYRKVKNQLYSMAATGEIAVVGKLKSTKYFIDKSV